jgi:hypothetical protein
MQAISPLFMVASREATVVPSWTPQLRALNHSRMRVDWPALSAFWTLLRLSTLGES